MSTHPVAIYRAWLNSSGHAEMTGSPADCSDKVGDEFTAGDGYISGRNIELDPGRRIVQSWRTTEFAESDPDSLIEVLLSPTNTGTLVTIRHTNIPDSQDSAGYEQGWIDYYLEPMKEYFSASS